MVQGSSSSLGSLVAAVALGCAPSIPSLDGQVRHKLLDLVARNVLTRLR